MQYHELTRSLRSSSTHQLSVPCHNLTFGSRAFWFSTTRVWNSLPVSIRESQSLPTFRRHPKTFIFSQPTALQLPTLPRISSFARLDSSKTLTLYKSFTNLLNIPYAFFSLFPQSTKLVAASHESFAAVSVFSCVQLHHISMCCL